MELRQLRAIERDAELASLLAELQQVCFLEVGETLAFYSMLRSYRMRGPICIFLGQPNTILGPSERQIDIVYL